MANGMEVYYPITKELYTTPCFKIDENSPPKHISTFHMMAASSVAFIPSMLCKTHLKPPLGTAVTAPSNTTSKPGYFIAVPHSTSSLYHGP